MRSSSVIDHRPQPMNVSAVSGTSTSRTKPDGQSDIDNSKVAIPSVTAETTSAASRAARTDGLAPDAVVAVVISAMEDVSRRPRPAFGFNRPLTKFAPTIAPEDGPPPRPADRNGRGRDMDLEQFFAKTPATLDELT